MEAAKGDLMHLDLTQIPPADILIAGLPFSYCSVLERFAFLSLPGGPPCPPWSAIGLREGSHDPRAAVFWHLTQRLPSAVCAAKNSPTRVMLLGESLT